ncbi:MAG: hypothetical protein M3Y03_02440, partial [Verrucomicrobiota bacterium]|nr:hypothetical protein [Verrucomicrobiota bacterium]
MRSTKIALSILLSLGALALFAMTFTPRAGASRTRTQAPPQDPDLAPGAENFDKETYLELRNAWVMARRGFDPKRPFDPQARERAIEQMGQQLIGLEAERKAGRNYSGLSAAAVSSSAWTPVGPAPLPQGQTDGTINPVTGRIIAVAVHPTNPDIVFVGTASGGLYRTLNGTAAQPTWTPLMDTIQMQANGITALGTLAIGVITIAPSDPNVVYIGTGEQATGYFGSGLYRIDAATTANPVLVGPINPTADYGDGTLSTFNFRSISQIVVHPTQPGTIFVSSSNGKGGIVSHNDSNPPNMIPPRATLGIYRSTNATGAANAVAFAKLIINGQDGFTTGNTDVSDMVLDPNDVTSNTVVAWVRSGGGVADACVAGGNCAGVFRTTNALGAGTFTQPLVALTGDVRGVLALNKTGATVTVLAGTAEHPDTAPNPNPNMCAANHWGLVRRSVDGGATWLNTDATAAGQGGIIRSADGFCGTQCFYDIAIAVDPTNANTIQIGGSGNYGGCQTINKRSTDGVTFAPNLNGLHADVHVVTVAPSNPAIVWTGDDGGLFRSTNSGATWSSVNGDPTSTTNPTGRISASQYISLATHPLDREYMTGGTQDDGTHLKRALGDTGEWTQIAFGDGGYTAIDQNATDTSNVTVYHTFFNIANGAQSQITYERVTTTADAKVKNWTTFDCAVGGAGNTAIDCNDTAVSFYAPMVVGPGNPNTLYFGTDSLYRSGNSGTTMQKVSQSPISAAGVESVSVSVG